MTSRTWWKVQIIQSDGSLWPSGRACVWNFQTICQSLVYSNTCTYLYIHSHWGLSTAKLLDIDILDVSTIKYTTKFLHVAATFQVIKLSFLLNLWSIYLQCFNTISQGQSQEIFFRGAHQNTLLLYVSWYYRIDFYCEHNIHSKVTININLIWL